MIPKNIHFVWLGGKKKNRQARKCIKSWRKYCPDYQIIEWNEDNFDINSVPYVKEACEAKKWAFASDYIRLYALYNYGGIYMDTDVEVVKPLEEFLSYKAFLGFERDDAISTGIMACEQGNEMFGDFLSYYDDKHFIKENGELDLTTNVTTITNICLEKGLVLNNQHQNIEGVELFPKDYFCPKEYMTGKLNCTDNTYAIHHFAGSWHTKKDKFKEFVKRIVGVERVARIMRKLRGNKAKQTEETKETDKAD